jgi:hypothetical protein
VLLYQELLECVEEVVGGTVSDLRWDWLRLAEPDCRMDFQEAEVASEISGD